MNHINNTIKEYSMISTKNSELGCMMSHLGVLLEISQNVEFDDDDVIGICEDDIFLGDNFNNNLNEVAKLEPVEFLFIGGRFDKNFSQGEGLVFRNNKDNDRCATSYLVKKSICEKLVNLVINNFVRDFSFNKHKKGIFIPLDRVYQSLVDDIKMYDYFPHLIYSPKFYKTDIQYIK
jgi:GR25 family glycosyltransferase involved in LPS biosynthesis